MPTKPLPSAAGCTLQDAGQDWDAIRVPRSVALAALDILGTRAGAVVDDGVGCYFFVPVGTAGWWDLWTTRALGTGSSITIPPKRRTEGPGPHWRMCPGDDRWLTEPRALRAAIEDACEPRRSAGGQA
jgi:hypothetical protein